MMHGTMSFKKKEYVNLPIGKYMTQSMIC